MPIYYHNPIITFQVVLTDPNRLVTGFQADTIDSIVKQLHQTIVYIPHVGPVRNGDTFTLYGKDALEVKDVYATEDEFAVLQVVSNPTPPVADFTHTDVIGELPLTVDFIDISAGVVIEWYWDFNGQAIDSNVKNPSFTFDTAGTYTITLIAANEGGADKKTVNITVVGIVRISYDGSGSIGLSSRISARATYLYQSIGRLAMNGLADTTSDTGEGSPPSEPLNFMITDTGDTFVTLSWNPPSDEGSDPVDGYPLQYKNNGMMGLDTEYQDFGTVEGTSITVEPLGSRKNYSFRVAAHNAVGSSDYTAPITQNTDPIIFPISTSVLLLTANDDNVPTYVYHSQTEEEYVPAEDGETVLAWGYNGGGLFQTTEAYQPVYRTGLINGDRTFNAVEFQGGTRMSWIDVNDFEQNISGTAFQNGFEALLLMRRLEPQPSTDRQTNGLWWLTSENPPAETDDTDVHYPEDNQVIYERFASGTGTSDPRRSIFPVPIDVEQWHIYQVRGRDGEYKIWLNGVLHYDSATNNMADAPTAPTPTIGVSYFWPPVSADDESSMHAGYFQLAEMLVFRPDEADPDNDISAEDAAISRAYNTHQILRYYNDKYDIGLSV